MDTEPRITTYIRPIAASSHVPLQLAKIAFEKRHDFFKRYHDQYK